MKPNIVKEQQVKDLIDKYKHNFSHIRTLHISNSIISLKPNRKQNLVHAETEDGRELLEEFDSPKKLEQILINWSPKEVSA